MRIFLDSCIIIYLIEGEDELRSSVAEAIMQKEGASFCASPLVRFECRVGPLRRGEDDILKEYDRFFENTLIFPMSDAVFGKAAELRAAMNLKTPDALHLACALINGCDEFWTNDKRLSHLQFEMTMRTIP